MSWAKRGLPRFIAASGRQPGRSRESAFTVQIDTTLHRSESRFSHDFQLFNPGFNRTLVTCYNKAENQSLHNFYLRSRLDHAIWVSTIHQAQLRLCVRQCGGRTLGQLSKAAWRKCG